MYILYPPSERSETGGYTVFTFVCLSVWLCVCAHSVQSSTVCVPPTTHQPSPSWNPCPSPTHGWWRIHLADICTLWAPSICVCFCCIGFWFLSRPNRDRQWNDLLYFCRVVRKTLTQTVNHTFCIYIMHSVCGGTSRIWGVGFVIEFGDGVPHWGPEAKPPYRACIDELRPKPVIF